LTWWATVEPAAISWTYFSRRVILVRATSSYVTSPLGVTVVFGAVGKVTASRSVSMPSGRARRRTVFVERRGAKALDAVVEKRVAEFLGQGIGLTLRWVYRIELEAHVVDLRKM
jgi:hypothetical protein